MLRCFVLLAAVAVAQLSWAAEPKVVQRWALLVGVDDYAYAQKLQYCGADQQALAKKLIAAGFPADQVFVLHDKAENPRFRPSQGNIERQLALVLNLADADDLVVIAFSGHGVHVGGKSYLCPAECTLDNPKTLIAVDEIYDRLKECAAGFKLVLVDACRNDPRPGGARTMTATEGTRALARTLHELKLPQGVVLLNSCAPGEISWEDEKFGHGVFMHYVLDGLDGAADVSGDGSISLNELQAYAGNRTKAYVANRHAVAQRPFFKGDLTTEALEYALLPVRLGKSDLPTMGPPLAVAPFDAAAAKLHQAAWAKHLNKEVESVNSIGMKLRLIPAGEFMMGTDEDALSVLQRFSYVKPDEIESDYPLHKVRLTKPFYLGAHEVTLGQFITFYHDAKYRVECERDGKGGSGWTGSSVAERRNFVPWEWGFKGQTNDHPVVNVTANDAATFCEWLSRKEGRSYRLPSEAEWEFACKAGTTTRFWFGDDVEEMIRYANGPDTTHRALWKDPSKAVLVGYGIQSNSTIPFPFLQGNDGYPFTAMIGRFTPNPFGLYDVHGNVGEWCGDWYDSRYYAESPTDDPQGPVTGSGRVSRGGGCGNPPATIRSACRGFGPADGRHYGQGFRVALIP